MFSHYPRSNHHHQRMLNLCESAGISGAWIGLTVQHCGNHGAMSTIPWVNKALGRCSDLVGGSSLAWQYHHQVIYLYRLAPPTITAIGGSVVGNII
jgi:hypothetical protein